MSYEVGYARSGRAACKMGLCKGTISKGDLRLGTDDGNYSVAYWTHWKCIKPSKLEKISSDTDYNPSNLHGFDELKIEDQELIKEAFKAGKVVNQPPKVKGEGSASISSSKNDDSKKRKASSQSSEGSNAQSYDSKLKFSATNEEWMTALKGSLSHLDDDEDLKEEEETDIENRPNKKPKSKAKVGKKHQMGKRQG